MTAETKAYIEQHINSIANNKLSSAWLSCPIHILNDFNNTMHIAGIEYPSEIHNYVVICCYISVRFNNVALHCYDFDYGTAKEDYEFICDNCVYVVEQLNHDLSVLLPKRSINVNISRYPSFRGVTITKLRIRVEVN